MTDETRKLEVDGTPVPLIEGDTILSAAGRAGVSIPTLCHAPGLSAEGGCRVCMVEVAGRDRPVAACHTPAAPGMVIRTDTPRLEQLRRGVLSLLREGYTRADLPLAEEGSELDGLFREYGVELPTVAPGAASETLPTDDSHPYLRFRESLCIVCARCIHACEDIQGQFVYAFGERGGETRLLFGPSERFADSPCVACGACVDHCPTGALTDRDRIEGRGADEVTDSVCGYCGVGCRIRVEAAKGEVLRVGGVPEGAVNRGHLCVKGRYAHAYHHSEDRLTRPLRREADGTFVEIDWDEAIRYAAERLSAIVDESGPDAVGCFTSSRSTNESGYLLQKLYRAVLRTNNVDCCARVCHSSTALALQLVTGTGAASASYLDIDRANCIVVAGANPTEAHPVVGARIKQAVLRGAKLIVIDPRRIELAEYADLHLALHPGTNVPLFNGLARALFDEGLVDTDFLEERVEGVDDFRAFLSELDLTEVAGATRVSLEEIREAARLMGHHRILFVHGLGLSELTQGTHSVMTLCNLGMLTGSIGRPGAGMLPLRGQNNVQGNADMGGMPNQITGYQPLDDPEVVARAEEVWGVAPPPEAGLTIPEMIRAAGEGTIRSLWIQGEDVAQSDPDETHVRQSLERLDFLIVQELFFSETSAYADLIFPATGALEHEGTFTNGERRIQLVRPTVPAPGEARPDWVAALEVARALGADWSYEGPAQIMDEIARIAPRLFGGVSYDRLEGDGLQWPCPDRHHPGTSTVHADGFLRGRGVLAAFDYLPSPEHEVEGYPFTLVTGRVLEHYNVGTMTRRTPQTELVPEDLLEMNPIDARALGIDPGDPVGLESRWGSTEATVRVVDRVRPGTLFLSFHFPETHANCLVGPHLDPQSKCPQYKATAVRVSAGGG